MSSASNTIAATMRARSRLSAPEDRCWSAMFAPRRQIAVDHVVHVQDVALLPRIQPRTGPARRSHPLLHVREVLVVLLGDLTPVAVTPVLEELGLHPAFVTGTRRAPLEDPGVLDATVGVV